MSLSYPDKTIRTVAFIRLPRRRIKVSRPQRCPVGGTSFSRRGRMPSDLARWRSLLQAATGPPQSRCHRSQHPRAIARSRRRCRCPQRRILAGEGEPPLDTCTPPELPPRPRRSSAHRHIDVTLPEARRGASAPRVRACSSSATASCGLASDDSPNIPLADPSCRELRQPPESSRREGSGGGHATAVTGGAGEPPSRGPASADPGAPPLELPPRAEPPRIQHGRRSTWWPGLPLPGAPHRRCRAEPSAGDGEAAQSSASLLRLRRPGGRAVPRATGGRAVGLGRRGWRKRKLRRAVGLLLHLPTAASSGRAGGRRELGRRAREYEMEEEHALAAVATRGEMEEGASVGGGAHRSTRWREGLVGLGRNRGRDDRGSRKEGERG
jgi:hypothetical protein